MLLRSSHTFKECVQSSLSRGPAPKCPGLKDTTLKLRNVVIQQRTFLKNEGTDKELWILRENAGMRKQMEV